MTLVLPVNILLKKRKIAPKFDHVDFPRGFPTVRLLPSGNVSSKILNDMSLHTKKWQIPKTCCICISSKNYNLDQVACEQVVYATASSMVMTLEKACMLLITPQTRLTVWLILHIFQVQPSWQNQMHITKTGKLSPPGHQSRSLSGGFHCKEAPSHQWSGCDQRSNQPGFMYLVFAFYQTLMAIPQSIHFLLVLSHTSGMYLVVTSKFSLPLM